MTAWERIPEDQQMQVAMDVLRRLVDGAPEPDELNEGLALAQVGNLADHVAELLVSGSDSDFPALFEQVESLITATPTTRYFAVVGFVEDLQNATLRRARRLDVWDEWLQTETRHAWTAVERMWSARLSARRFNAYVRTGDAKVLGQSTSLGRLIARFW